ncbi:unnamed protein product, partial [Adineta steineri]
LVDTRDTDGKSSFETANAIDGIFRSSAVMIAFGPMLISKLCMYEEELECLKNVSLDELIRKFFDTQDADWLLSMTEVAFRKGAAVAISEDKLIAYDNGEPIELCIPDWKLLDELIKTFTSKAKALHLSFGIPSNPEN